jgi:hypothetical protein
MKADDSEAWNRSEAEPSMKADDSEEWNRSEAEPSMKPDDSEAWNRSEAEPSMKPDTGLGRGGSRCRINHSSPADWRTGPAAAQPSAGL